MHELELFPVLIAVVPNFLETYQLTDLVDYAKKIKMTQHSELVGDAVSSHNPNSFDLNNIAKIESCKNIILDLQAAVDFYAAKYGFFKSKISNSWLNIQKKHSALNYHTHPGSVVSGALYVKIDEKSSKLSFLNPNPYIKFTAKDGVNLSKYMYEFAFIAPNAGDLVLFPSWMSHGSGVEKNMSNERIVISFNTNYNEMEIQK